MYHTTPKFICQHQSAAKAENARIPRKTAGEGPRSGPAWIYGRRRGVASCGRREPPAKGEPPARVPPFTPSCTSLVLGSFRALRRAARGAAPGPRPLFCKKAGQKTFIPGRGHFPTQKRENMRSVTSSRTLRPVSSASASRASSASVSTASGVKPAASVSHAASSAASARWTASA